MVEEADGDDMEVVTVEKQLVENVRRNMFLWGVRGLDSPPSTRRPHARIVA